jgi:hypothetical protein
MSEEQTDYWFPTKTYGFGWGLPVRWQGWAVLIAYFALLVVGIRYFGTGGHAVGLSLYVLLLTGGLVGICIWKGERPLGWRWGRR